MQNLQMLIYKNWILLLIIFLGIFFRFFQIGSVPPSPSVDEVSTGFNAYSLLQTGRDEYGEKFPLILRSYDDYQPALYAYLVIPFISIFGLTTESVRMPSVLLSIITLISTYFLANELFKKDKNVRLIGIWSVLFLAISPWHIYVSRLGFPANPGLSFMVLGVLFFVKRKFQFSLPLFALSFIAYHSEKIILPFVFIFLVVFYRRDILQLKKQFALGLIIAGIIAIPFIKASFSPEALKRLEATSIKNSYDLKFLEEKEKYVQARNSNDLFGRVIHSEKFVTASIVVDNYKKHFYPEWLFTNKEDRAMHKIPSLGLLHIFESVLILLGIIYLLRSKQTWATKGLILVGVFSAPLAAAITSEAPHAVRSYTFLPWLHMLSGVGFVWMLSFMKKKSARSITIVVVVLVLTFVSTKLYKSYFVVFPSLQSSSFYLPQYNAIKYVSEERNNYKKIVVDVKDNLYQSYMYYLFITQYEPATYLSKGGTVSGGYEQEHKIENIEFRPIGKDEVIADNILYIINKKDAIQGNVIEEFADFKGNILVQAVTK